MGRLVLHRRVGEVLHLGDDITLTCVEVRGGQVRLAIDAPPNVAIRRGEVPGREDLGQCPQCESARVDRLPLDDRYTCRDCDSRWSGIRRRAA